MVGVSKFGNALLLLKMVPSVVQGIQYDGGAKLLGASKNIPLILGMRCISRSRNPSTSEVDIERSFNGTDDLGDLLVFEVGEAPFPYCPEGYFCDLLVAGNEDKARDADDVFGLCRPCFGGPETCASDPLMVEATETPQFLAHTLAECEKQCGVEQNTCLSKEACNLGTFCNFQQGDSGFCEQCPPHLVVCSDALDAGNLTEAGHASCESSCSSQCYPESKIRMSVGVNGGETLYETLDDVNSIHFSVQGTVTGPIVDCGLGLSPCEGAEGAICVIERGVETFVNKTINCFLGGGVAAIIYNTEQNCKNFRGTFWALETYIPAVTLSHIDGRDLIEKAQSLDKPMNVTVEVGGNEVVPALCELGCTEANNKCNDLDLVCNWDMGDIGECEEQAPRKTCTDSADVAIGERIFCTEEGEFCDYSEGAYGECNQCPANGALCFFSNLNKDGAIECNERCTDGSLMELEAKPCKFCPKGSFTLGDIGDAFSTTEDNAELVEPCQFCASTSKSTCETIKRWDMKYPNRTLEMFGNQVECWKVAEFYNSLGIEADSDVCASARSFNYICGCSDSAGYAGARSQDQQMMLVWFPRVGAILSIIGSTLLIVLTLHDEKKRKKVIGELIIFLCAFDIVGSLGYAFTSLPTPKEDYIYGAKGDAGSCTAQAFFIQIGTISLYINVSIALYYYLTIQRSWREHNLRNSWVYPQLFIVPIVIGAIFAFAGIPYYDNAILWCNNSQKYWSEIPVAVAIGIATILMVSLCCYVFQEERASRRFRRHTRNERASLSKAVFRQCLLYLFAFYLTWPAYLALQIMLANGRGYSQYGFILFAGTSATLQGFWNFVFHLGSDLQRVKEGASMIWSSIVVGGSSSFLRQNAESSTFQSRTISRKESRDKSTRDHDLESRNKSSKERELTSQTRVDQVQEAEQQRIPESEVSPNSWLEVGENIPDQ